MIKIWYAVQETPEDPWDYGSSDLLEAAHMLMDQGQGLIAVINEDTNTCIDEIHMDQILQGKSGRIIVV